MLRTARQTPRPCGEPGKAGSAVSVPPLTGKLCACVCGEACALHASRLPGSSPRWPRCWCRPCARAWRAGRSASARPRRTTPPSCPTAPTSSTASSCWPPPTWRVMSSVTLEQRRAPLHWRALAAVASADAVDMVTSPRPRHACMPLQHCLPHQASRQGGRLGLWRAAAAEGRTRRFP